jgi:hypothetical protein
MDMIIGILAAIVGIGSLVCWIMVLIKMFQGAGVLQGILGIICGLWAFIWGWMNAGTYGIKNVMIVWSVLVVLGVIFNSTLSVTMQGL